MIEFNDSNANVTRNGFSIFFDAVDTSEDVFISSTCIFMDDFRTTGNLKAQYSLTVHGCLNVGGTLNIGGDLTCGTLEANDVDVERDLYAREDVSARKLFIGGNADVGYIFAQNVISYGNIFAREGIDIQGDLTAQMAVIGLDYISAAGTLKCAQSVSSSIDAGNDLTGSVSLIPQQRARTGSSGLTAEPARVPIADSEIGDIFDGHSNLAVGMEDYALFIEKLNQQLCTLEPSDKSLLELLETYGSFIPTYLDVHSILDDTLNVVAEPEPNHIRGFQDMLICGQALLQFPEWFRDSTVVNRYMIRFRELLESVIESGTRTKSKREWMQALGLVECFRVQYPDEMAIQSMLEALSEHLFRNTGLKALTVQLYLPEK